MSYHSNSLVQDVQDKLDDAERAVTEVKEGYVCDLEPNLDTILEHISNAEDELRYVNDELEEKSDYLDEIEGRYGSVDPDDWSIISEDDFEDRVSELHKELNDKLTEACTQVTHLQYFHENQKLIISALLAQFRLVHGATSEAELVALMQEATANVKPLVTDQS